MRKRDEAPGAKLTRRRLLLAADASALPLTARAQAAPAVPEEVRAAIAAARLSGSGEFRYLGFLVYRATLWVGPQGLGSPLGTAPFALQLRYARSLEGADIAARSEEEMRKLGEGSATQRSAWLQAMQRLFPDVTEGDTLTGVFTPAAGTSQPAQTRFYFNGVLRGEVSGTAFAQAFFAIWLSPQTPAPELRNDLLAAASTGSAP
jgi:hypothetical protein